MMRQFLFTGASRRGQCIHVRAGSGNLVGLKSLAALRMMKLSYMYVQYGPYIENTNINRIMGAWSRTRAVMLLLNWHDQGGIPSNAIQYLQLMHIILGS